MSLPGFRKRVFKNKLSARITDLDYFVDASLVYANVPSVFGEY